MAEKIFPAEECALYDVLSFVEAELEKGHCAAQISMAALVAIEEVFVNVARYAYTGSGKVKLAVTIDDGQTATFTLTDEGVPFDPLQREMPDITLSAEERPIGGLGILIAQKTMDAISYCYKDGQNILTMRKNLQKPAEQRADE